VLNTYYGKELLSNAKLNLDPEKIPKNLLREETMQHLKQSYIAVSIVFVVGLKSWFSWCTKLSQ